jgi:hypothetical protein
MIKIYKNIFKKTSFKFNCSPAEMVFRAQQNEMNDFFSLSKSPNRIIKIRNFTLVLSKAGLWIRIRIRIGSKFRDFVDPDPDPGARKLRNFSGKMQFLVIFIKNIFTTEKL